MLRDTLIVHSKLDQDEIRVLWDMQREAELSDPMAAVSE
jgi:hypothetical protein